MADSQRGDLGTWKYLAWWREDGSIELERTLATLPASDRDSAELFASCWPDQMFYEPKASGPGGTWYLWDTHCQRPDRSKAIDRWVSGWSHMLDKLFEHCRQQLNAETRRDMDGKPDAEIKAAADKEWALWVDSLPWKYAHGLRGTAGANRLREAVSGATGTDVSLWPPNKTMINAANCVVSLDPGSGWAWRDHDPSLRMTYCLPTPWQPADPTAPMAGCPQFTGLLDHACGRDADVFWHLVHALGYSLLGDNRYRLMFFLSGPTSSGKTTLLEVVSRVLGPLAHEAKPELITRAAIQRHGRHEASIIGKRLVTIGETNSQLVLDENQLKALTGQERAAVDVLWRAELTDAIISALIFVANNDMPAVAHLDEALAQRIWVSPMGETIPPELRDSAMRDRIVGQEAGGILSALVWACRNVMRSDGKILTMPAPPIVRKTAAYRREQNTALLWFGDRCVSANGSTAAQRGSFCLSDYRDWCDENRRVALGQHHFYSELSMLPGVGRTGPADQAWFTGFVLSQPLQQPYGGR
jgi:P4 family phage/plasmid primase-like protien